LSFLFFPICTTLAPHIFMLFIVQMYSVYCLCGFIRLILFPDPSNLNISTHNSILLIPFLSINQKCDS